MKRAGSIRTKYLTHLSQPPQDRRVYQAIAQFHLRSILEIGIGSGERASRMIELALRYHEAKQVRYVGIDLFESRPAENPGLTLKRAYQSLLEWGASAQLLPGEASHVLPNAANALGPVDLIVISSDQEIELRSRAWYYFPRIVASDALVFEQRLETPAFTQLSTTQLQARADAIAIQLRRAA